MRPFSSFIVILFIVCTSHSWGQSDSTLLYQRIPKWAQTVLSTNELFKNYTIIDSINPFYFEADFTGDGTVDIVFMVRHNLSDKVGLFIINGGKNIAFVLGAGKDIGMGDNIAWCDKWFVYRDKFIYNFDARKKKLTLKYPAIEIQKNDQRSIILYWDKRKYKTAIKNVP